MEDSSANRANGNIISDDLNLPSDGKMQQLIANY